MTARTFSPPPWRLGAILSIGALLPLPQPVWAQGFGSAVATGDREILIGNPSSPYSPGTVYVYRSGGGDGAWREVARLRASDGAPLDRFGRSVALAGDRALIGATSADSGRGAAYVFEREASGAWKQTAKLVPPGAEPGEAFGRVVALSGETAYVAGWGHGEGRGAVTVWQRAGSGQWSLAATLGASDAAPRDLFGTALAPDGDRLLVGAAQKDSATGAAYLFHRDPATGTWLEETKLSGSGLTQRTGYGQAVALRGDTALVGAPGLDRGSGAVHVFVRNPESGRWLEASRLRPFDGAPGTQFGAELGLLGSAEIWIGAPGAEGRQGRIYRLTRGPAGGLTAAIKLGAEDLERGDGFGGAFALGGGGGGSQAVVGLPGDDFGAGTAVILTRAADGRWTAVGKVWSEDKGLEPIAGGKVSCAEGKARLFDCRNVDLLAFLPVSALGGGRGVRVNDIWGWTDPEGGREYALVGRVDGTAFVDVSDPANPAYLGDLPKTAGAQASIWRDIKVYRNHAFIVADGALSHGMQVFDLTRLRGAARGRPATFTEDAHYDRIHSAHNIVVDTATGYAFIVGASAGGETCGGGLHMVDIRDPRHPAFAGCFADPATGRASTGYTHDAQCVVYHGPDETYRGRELCFNASETALGIADVTDKANPKAIARAAYPNVAYTHQGWLTEDQRFFLMDDELDELAGTVSGTRTLIFDVSDLDDPVLAGEYISANRATDHNLYIQGHLMYQSNYVSGLRVFDVSDPAHPSPVGFFDTVPLGEDAPGFGGSWSNYPFFKSGTLVVTSMSEGLFILKRSDQTLIP